MDDGVNIFAEAPKLQFGQIDEPQDRPLLFMGGTGTRPVTVSSLPDAGSQPFIAKGASSSLSKEVRGWNQSTLARPLEKPKTLEAIARERRVSVLQENMATGGVSEATKAALGLVEIAKAIGHEELKDRRTSLMRRASFAASPGRRKSQAGDLAAAIAAMGLDSKQDGDS